MKYPKTIHDDVREVVELAFSYGEDGAMFSAARLLRKAADIYEKRHNDMQRAIEANDKK